MKNAHPALYLFVSTPSSYTADIKRIEITVCTRNPSKDRPEGMSRMEYGHGEWQRGLAFVKVYALVFKNDPNWRPSIEFAACDNLGGEKMESVQATVSAHSHIQRYMDKLAKLAGPANTLGAFATRFASAIGAKGLIRKSPRDDMQWQVLGCDMIAFTLDGMVREYVTAEPVAA